MTQDEQTLLTKALCEYLPYGTYVEYSGLIVALDNLYVFHNYNFTNEIQSLEGSLDFFHDTQHVNIENLKLYLRPMSSMTDKERAEYYYLQNAIPLSCNLGDRSTINEAITKYNEFLKSHHFDYLGLIDKGLAYEAESNLYSIDDYEKYTINEKTYRLIEYIDNSAPCCYCAFLNKGNLKCNFPKNEEKKCRRVTGTTHGWNTLEYQLYN